MILKTARAPLRAVSLLALVLILSSGCATTQAPLQKASLPAGHTRTQHEAFSEKVMIATQGPHATEAGLEMIRLGGNAIDAAAAISFVISVERPQSTGIGGGGFMLLAGPEVKKPMAVDFREKAPIAAESTMFLDEKGNPQSEKSIDGILAVGVPGLVKGVLEVHEKYGKLSRRQILAPAIRLAREGFKVYPHLAKALEDRKDVLKKSPAAVEIFFKRGKPLKEGGTLVQRNLARTLEEIARKGAPGFYDGWVANAIVNESDERGGLITRRDLIRYNVKWREPVRGKFKDYEIYSMSPPSSGGTHVIQILNIVEPMGLKSQGVQSAETIHETATAMQLAFVDRARYMGDPDFVKVPVEGLISEKYAAELRKKIGKKALKIKPKDLISAFDYESPETTHFTVMDSAGNVVSSTQTINGWMGSGVVVPETGIVLNNEMDDFSQKPGHSNLFKAVGSLSNLVEPEKRPLSSMSPTLVLQHGKPVVALGSPSGTRIITCVAQVLLNYLEHELPLYDSLAVTRYHHQWSPDQLRIGDPGLPEETVKELRAKGHKVHRENLGCRVQAVAREGKRLHGVSDPRGEGLAQGI